MIQSTNEGVHQLQYLQKKPKITMLLQENQSEATPY